MGFMDQCEQGILLSTLSTFEIGGPARFVFKAKSISNVQEAFAWANGEGCPVFVVGHGSNCLFSDSGFAGLVIVNRIEAWHQEDRLFHVGGGHGFAAFGVRVANEGWGGVEFAAGIPGTVGGAVVMNAGACGQQVADTLHYVDWVEMDGQFKRFAKEEIGLGYRHSAFQGKRGAIVAAGFLLNRSEEAKQRQKAMIKERVGTQPVKEKSAGCVFKNPPGASAGRLIEEAGLKGYKIGGAEVSTVHANFIVNRGGAKACEVCELIAFIQQEVAKRSGYTLETEVKVIGDAR